MLTLKCPRCKKNQKYDPRGGIVSGKVKRCVYCGRSFKVHCNVEKSRIVG